MMHFLRPYTVERRKVDWPGFGRRSGGVLGGVLLAGVLSAGWVARAYAQGMQVTEILESPRLFLLHSHSQGFLGVDVGDVFHRSPGEPYVTGPDPQRRSYASFISFSDPDGNTWIVQEVTARLPGRG